jgi:hypothetical protein
MAKAGRGGACSTFWFLSLGHTDPKLLSHQRRLRTCVGASTPPAAQGTACASAPLRAVRPTGGRDQGRAGGPGD